MRDSESKRSRGFGFVTYSQESEVDAAQQHRPHNLDGRDVEAKRAVPRGDNQRSGGGGGSGDSYQQCKKVFIGGLREGIEENDLKEFFSQYGEIESVHMITDKATGKKRGFAFINFTDYDVVDKICIMKYHVIRDVKLEAKKAVARDDRSGGYTFN